MTDLYQTRRGMTTRMMAVRFGLAMAYLALMAVIAGLAP